MSTDPSFVAYLGVADRLSTLVDGAADAQLAAAVPACPAWTVDDVIRHLVGITADWVEGRLDDYGTNLWTTAQIARFDGDELADVVAWWPSLREQAARLEPNAVMGPVGTWLFGDACVHEADLRPVLAPGTRPPADAVALATKAGIARWRGHAVEHELDPIVVDAVGTREWRIGAADEASPRLTVDSYELFRALYGRRSASQVASWNWGTDPTPWIDAGLPHPFVWAAHDLTGE